MTENVKDNKVSDKMVKPTYEEEMKGISWISINSINSITTEKCGGETLIWKQAKMTNFF